MCQSFRGVISVTLPVHTTLLRGAHCLPLHQLLMLLLIGNTGKQTTASFCFFAHHHGSTAQKSELFAQKLLSPHLRLCAHLSAYNDQAAKGDQG